MAGGTVEWTQNPTSSLYAAIADSLPRLEAFGGRSRRRMRGPADYTASKITQPFHSRKDGVRRKAAPATKPVPANTGRLVTTLAKPPVAAEAMV